MIFVSLRVFFYCLHMIVDLDGGEGVESNLCNGHFFGLFCNIFNIFVRRFFEIFH